MNNIKNNTILATAIVILFVGGLTFYITQNKAAQPQIKSPDTDIKIETNNSVATSSAENKAKVFDISGKPFEFSLKEIKVKKGDRIKINFTNTQGFHDLVVDEFNTKTKQIQAGQTDSMEFVADKVGAFDYYCSVPTHRQQGMTGKLVVEE